MRNGRAWVGVVLVAAVALIAGGSAWYFRKHTAAEYCSFCTRPVHANARAVAEYNVKRRIACCPSCALAYRAQTRTKLRLVSVSDFDTQRELDPNQAAYLVGSDVQTCTGHAGSRVDEEGRPLAIHYDRCEPSILAFATRERAEQFAREHGGKVATLAELGMR